MAGQHYAPSLCPDSVSMKGGALGDRGQREEGKGMWEGLSGILKADVRAFKPARAKAAFGVTSASVLLSFSNSRLGLNCLVYIFIGCCCKTCRCLMRKLSAPSKIGGRCSIRASNDLPTTLQTSSLESNGGPVWVLRKVYDIHLARDVYRKIIMARMSP